MRLQPEPIDTLLQIFIDLTLAGYRRDQEVLGAKDSEYKSDGMSQAQPG